MFSPLYFSKFLTPKNLPTDPSTPPNIKQILRPLPLNGLFANSGFFGRSFGEVLNLFPGQLSVNFPLVDISRKHAPRPVSQLPLLARVLTRLLARVLIRVSGKEKSINTVCRTTRPKQQKQKETVETTKRLLEPLNPLKCPLKPF